MKKTEAMTEKRIAILVPESFYCAQLSEALSMLYWSTKKYDIFSPQELVVSEEGLTVRRTKNPREFSLARYDSLLVIDTADIDTAAEDSSITAFLRCFNPEEHFVAAAGSAPLLLLKAGIIEGKHFSAGCDSSDFERLGITGEQRARFVEPDELNEEKSVIADGKLLTGSSKRYRGFIMRLCALMDLELDME